jgi:hypothetical protein
MKDEHKTAECIRKRLLVENIKEFDLYKLSVERLLDIATTLDEKFEKRQWRDNDKSIIDKYVDLQRQISWVKKLKVGDKVAFKDSSYYEIVEIMETCDDDGRVRISQYPSWVDASGNFLSDRYRIMPITQEILDHMEKEEIVEKLYKKTNFRDVQLEDLRAILQKVKASEVKNDDSN